MRFRILKMIATSGFLTALQCTKFVFGRDSIPDPAGELTVLPPDPLAGLTKVRGKGEWKKEGEGGAGFTSSICIFCVRHCILPVLLWQFQKFFL